MLNSAVLIGTTFGRQWIPAVWLVVAQYLGFAGLFLYYGISFLGNITELPQWTVFLAISVMIWLGMRAGRAGR